VNSSRSALCSTCNNKEGDETKACEQYVQFCEGSLWEPEDYGGKDLWNEKILRLERKTEGVLDSESKGCDCDEVMCAK